MPTLTDSFARLAEQHFTPADQATLFAILEDLFAALTKERKSTIVLRQEARELEQVLAQEGFAAPHHLAKQIARFNLSAGKRQLLELLKQYEADALMGFLETCSRIVNASRDIKLSIEMITRIVNALKVYSRLDQARLEEVDLHEGLETTLIILQSQIKRGVEVDRRYGDLPKIPCYANELNQVWTNIMHNALQAMKGTGKLTIETYRLRPDDQEEKIGVNITDTGPGIPLAIRTKIFDPFFTTKDQGEGSGLGLSIARQIIERHHGQIRLTSTPGETNFEVLLPVAALRREYLAQ